uniref:Putative head tail connector protein n=1 Tax=viral metagenome TaxID=1070528 RepID=A0A6M3IPL3_9ZZZZ
MNKETVALWLDRVRRCESLQGKKDNERKQNIKLYIGEFFGDPYSKDSDLNETSFVFEFMKILIGSIYARNPHIFVRSYSGSWAAFAETMETVINYYWGEKRLKDKIKKAIIDAVLQPPGFIEIGYLLISEKKKVMRDLEGEFPELKEVKKEKVESEQGILDETIKEDDVFANFISSWNVMWPDGYHIIRECPYLIIKQKVSYLDLKLNPMYKNVGDLRGFSQSNDNSKPTSFTMKANPRTDSVYSGIDEETIPITLYHIFDKRSQKRFTLAKNYTKDSLFERDWNYLIDGFPVYDLIFNEIPQTDENANSYPLSDIKPMIPDLKELSYISSAMNKHRKRAGTLLLGKTGEITEDEATLIQKAHDVDLVLVDNPGEQNLRGFTPPALPQDFYALRGITLENLMRTSGFQQLLSQAKGVESATESDNIRIGSQIRQSEKQDIIEDFTVEVAKGLGGLIWQFIQDKKRISEIIGEEVTDEMWPELPKDEKEARRLIQRELHFKIEAGSTRPPKDEAIERKQWMDLVAVLKANFPGRFKEDLTLKQILKKFEFRDIDNLVISFDEEEAAQAQKENEMLLQGIPCLISPNGNDMLHLQIHSQAYQIPGLQITPEMDDHILQHSTNMQRKNPSMIPQKGDSKAAVRTNNPDIKRKGITENADLQGAVDKTGSNRGGGITR